MVGVHARVRRDVHGLLGHGHCVHAVDVHECPRRGGGVRSPRADADDSVVGFDDVTTARDLERVVLVRHHHGGLQSSEVLVVAPRLGELHRGARELARVLLELHLQPFEEGERVRSRAGEPSDDPAWQPTHFLHVGLDDLAAQRDLPVRHHHDLAILADAEHRGGVRGGAREGSGSARRGRTSRCRRIKCACRELFRGSSQHRGSGTSDL